MRTMREAIAATGAAFTVFRRRRGAFALFVVLVAMMGVTVWGSYAVVRQERRTLAEVRRGRFQFFDLGFSCDPTSCRLALPNGQTLGPSLDPSIIQGTNGQPPDPQTLQDFFKSHTPQIEDGLRQAAAALNRDFSPRRILGARARSLGSLWGVIFVTLLGAALFGAEWRWSVWRTLLTHEPRRARVLFGKLTALWLLVAIAFIATLGLVAAADTIFRAVYSVEVGGGPTIGAMALGAGRSLLGVEFFATLAAMFAMIFRSSLAGLGGSLAIALLDGLATQHFVFLRHYLPDQQVAVLLPHSGRFLTVASPWWRTISGTLKCPGFPNDCHFIAFRPIQPGTAAAVLGAWLVAAAVVAYVVLRARDVPQ